MKISSRGIDLLKSFEGFSSEAYQCSAKVWTIGYGFTDGVKEGDKITKKEAEARLLHELRYYEHAVKSTVTVPLEQNQFDALVCFVYNIGEGAFKRSILLEKLNEGKFEEVPAQMARWNRAGKKVVLGLTRRRQAEAALFMESLDKAPMAQAVDSPDKSLAKSRTIAGASIAGTATIAGEIVNETKEQLEGVIPYAESLKLVFLVVALIGIGLTIYAKIDERRS